MICQNDCMHSKAVPMKAPVYLDHIMPLLFFISVISKTLAMPVIWGSCPKRAGYFYLTMCRLKKDCRWELPTQEACDLFLCRRNSAPQ